MPVEHISPKLGQPKTLHMLPYVLSGANEEGPISLLVGGIMSGSLSDLNCFHQCVQTGISREFPVRAETHEILMLRPFTPTYVSRGLT